MLIKPAVALALVLVCAGCGKRDSGKSATPPPNPGPAVSIESLATPSAEAPAAPPSAPASPEPSQDTAAPLTPKAAKLPPEMLALKKVYEAHFERYGNFPSSWKEMIDTRSIKSVPSGPDGKPLEWGKFIELITQ
jgi:hypothetical protein